MFCYSWCVTSVLGSQVFGQAWMESCVIGPTWYERKKFQNFQPLYIGQMWAIEAMQVSPGGPDTHNNPHQRRAARTAAKHLFCVEEKKQLTKIPKAFLSVSCGISCKICLYCVTCVRKFNQRFYVRNFLSLHHVLIYFWNLNILVRG